MGVMKYRNADEWRTAAMRRPDGVDGTEIEKRREIARRHHIAEGLSPDADTLADQELYIRGKMDIEEYQEYLLYKHGQNSSQ